MTKSLLYSLFEIAVVPLHVVNLADEQRRKGKMFTSIKFYNSVIVSKLLTVIILS